MAPLDPLTLGWVRFSELVPGQGSRHPIFLMIFGKWTHASLRLAWVHGSAACMGPPQLGLLCGAALPGARFSKKKQVPGGLQPKTVFLAFY